MLSECFRSQSIQRPRRAGRYQFGILVWRRIINNLSYVQTARRRFCFGKWKGRALPLNWMEQLFFYRGQLCKGMAHIHGIATLKANQLMGWIQHRAAPCMQKSTWRDEAPRWTTRSILKNYFKMRSVRNFKWNGLVDVALKSISKNIVEYRTYLLVILLTHNDVGRL